MGGAERGRRRAMRPSRPPKISRALNGGSPEPFALQVQAVQPQGPSESCCVCPTAAQSVFSTRRSLPKTDRSLQSNSFDRTSNVRSKALRQLRQSLRSSAPKHLPLSPPVNTAAAVPAATKAASTASHDHTRAARSTLGLARCHRMRSSRLRTKVCRSDRRCRRPRSAPSARWPIRRTLHRW